VGAYMNMWHDVMSNMCAWYVKKHL